MFGGGAGGCGSGEGGAEQRGGDIIVQFSSIGSLSSKWLHEFTLSLDLDSQRARVAGAGGAGGAAEGGGGGSKKRSRGKGKAKPPWTKDAVSPLCREKLKLVWPTVGEVRDSEEGYRAGSSIPGTQKNVSKLFLLPLYHHWKSMQGKRHPMGRATHAPHIKTYMQLAKGSSPGGGPARRGEVHWMVLASHNLSTAAWGEMQTNSKTKQPQLFMRSWELGVRHDDRMMA